MARPTVDTAIVLAGGLGTRLRSAVPDLPKPLAPISGRPFLEYLLDYWHGQGIRRFILSVGYRAELIRAHFGSTYRGCRIDYAEEQTPLGTGGGLLLASAMAEGGTPLLAINGDTFFAVELHRLADFHAAHRADWTFCTFRTSVNGRYLGMDIAPNGKKLGGTAGKRRGLSVFPVDPRRHGMQSRRSGLVGRRAFSGAAGERMPFFRHRMHRKFHRYRYT